MEELIINLMVASNIKKKTASTFCRKKRGFQFPNEFLRVYLHVSKVGLLELDCEISEMHVWFSGSNQGKKNTVPILPLRNAYAFYAPTREISWQTRHR